MRAKVLRWGNSLGLRLPKKLAEDAKVAEGSLVELWVDRGRLLVAPIAERIYSLDELVRGINSRNCHTSLDWGSPVGREVW
jgi:antitoxin MazE